jgi:hypothetical protein
MDPSRAFIKDAKRVVVKVRWLCLLFSWGGGELQCHTYLFTICVGVHIGLIAFPQLYPFSALLSFWEIIRKL